MPLWRGVLKGPFSTPRAFGTKSLCLWGFVPLDLLPLSVGSQEGACFCCRWGGFLLGRGLLEVGFLDGDRGVVLLAAGRRRCRSRYHRRRRGLGDGCPGVHRLHLVGGGLALVFARLNRSGPLKPAAKPRTVSNEKLSKHARRASRLGARCWILVKRWGTDHTNLCASRRHAAERQRNRHARLRMAVA